MVLDVVCLMTNVVRTIPSLFTLIVITLLDGWAWIRFHFERLNDRLWKRRKKRCKRDIEWHSAYRFFFPPLPVGWVTVNFSNSWGFDLIWHVSLLILKQYGNRHKHRSNRSILNGGSTLWNVNNKSDFVVMERGKEMLRVVERGKSLRWHMRRST